MYIPTRLTLPSPVQDSDHASNPSGYFGEYELRGTDYGCGDFA